MGIENIALLFPGDDFVPGEEPFVVSELSGGRFSVSGPSSAVGVVDETHFFINSPQATDNGDGSFTVSSE